MKIAVCSPISLTNFSGAAKFLIDVAKLMAYHGHDVKVYALPLGSNRTVSLSKVQSLLSTVPYYETSKIQTDADIAYVNYAPFIWRRMKTKGVRIAGLHTHLLLPNQHMSKTLMHPLEAGYEWYAKATSFAVLLPLIKADLMSFDAVHIPLGGFSLCGQTKLYKIPLWIDVNKIRRERPTKFDKFTVLFAGRKTWEKGWSTFCEISSKLKRMGYDFAFLCTGEGHGDIRGLGFLSEDELFNIYQRSHIVVYPSIADVFGLVILEAAACGVPVVTTPIGVHIDQHLPVLYASNPQDFVKAILVTHSLWNEQPDKYHAWCQTLRASAEKYDVNRIFPMFERMLEDTIAEGASKFESRMSVGWTEPRVAFCHKSEKLSRIQRFKELSWASKSLGRNLRGLALDVGGGKGYVASLLNELGCQTVGLDIKPSFVRQMVKTGLHGVLADGEKLPFKSSIFDQVTCFEVIEHLDNPEGALKEIHRVLKNEGLLILTAPVTNPVNVMIDFVRGERTHVSEMSMGVLLSALRKYFKRVTYKPILALPIPPSLFGRYYWLETGLLANHIWACGEK